MKKHTPSPLIPRALAASLLLAGTQAFALECPLGQWLAEYYPNTKLAGAPVLTRCETGPIDYYWMTDSPDARLPVDAFSARWTATLPFSAGNARFTTYTDDGVRVFVDGKRVINNWTRHGITEDTATVKLKAGAHTVRMEYFEAGGEGLAQLFIDGASAEEPPPPPPPRIGTFAAQPGTIDAGGTSILTWLTENATACTASGAWSGEQAASGSASVKPAATSTYALSCRNAAGAAVSASATVTVRARQPDPQDPPPPGDGLSATATPAGVRLAWTASPQGRKWVNGYYAGWFWETYPPEAVDMSTMTHFVFGRYAPALGSLPGGRAGDLLEGAGGAHAEVEDTLIAKAHAAGVKAVMMVGGDSDGPGFVAATANATVRARFIRNILDKAVQKGYDGVDIDWEENLDTPATRAQALALLRELRAASEQRPRYQAAPLEISWPGFWVNKNDPDITPWHAEVAAAVDRFNLMTYSMAGDWGWLSWHHSPLFGADTYHPTSIESTVQAYLQAGVPRAKLGIGIGLYGAYYNAPVTGPRQSLDGMQGWMDNGDWENNTQRLVNDNAFGQPGATYHWDDVAKQSYITYSQPWNRGPNTPVTYLSYEDERSIQEKGQWVREQNLGGTLVWTVNYGWLPQQNANPQMQAVKQSFIAGAARYRVYRDGTAIATTDDPRYVDAAAPSGSHGYQVSVVDAQGREGPRSAPVTVQVP
ncbi:glycosyl hydrolase family 18 protein [Acidovorax sp. MR-S7]|uniref:glycosyl hydrolase family 18 protein n=1 Tax=Acidovorax sp. MR-S7 TaxID=1268622 RepID=UPI0003775DF7|nr:glycosyl hydrolase family 18 protein [Acidovorax sp. MR-S7]GAD23345.1 chitinase [Acidovorax sp. MR-S7]